MAHVQIPVADADRRTQYQSKYGTFIRIAQQKQQSGHRSNGGAADKGTSKTISCRGPTKQNKAHGRRWRKAASYRAQQLKGAS